MGLPLYSLSLPLHSEKSRCSEGEVTEVQGPHPPALCPQVFLALGELLLSCNWAVVADILLVGVGVRLEGSSRGLFSRGSWNLPSSGWTSAVRWPGCWEGVPGIGDRSH